LCHILCCLWCHYWVSMSFTICKNYENGDWCLGIRQNHYCCHNIYLKTDWPTSMEQSPSWEANSHSVKFPTFYAIHVEILLKFCGINCEMTRYLLEIYV
jgi:hypothetical protein